MWNCKLKSRACYSDFVTSASCVPYNAKIDRSEYVFLEYSVHVIFVAVVVAVV